MMKLLTCLLFFIACNTIVNAQVQLPVARNYATAYDNQTRSATGEPGSKYWQNTADYNISVSFAPATRLIDGDEDIVYTNNSPDTLHRLLFKLYPNVYKKGSPRDFIIKPEDISDGGMIINRMNINDTVQNIDSIIIRGTNMVVKTGDVMPGATIKLKIGFSYMLNKTSHNRTGMVNDSSAFIAYFFPRIAVYDDIDGWNTNEYTGSQEFYNDFCNFNVAISVPKNYVVCATGNLTNASQVLDSNIVARIAKAELTDELTKIIDTTDVRQNITASIPINTWKFTATNVTDFAFATANHYIWYAKSVMVDSSTQRRTRVDVVFNPAHKDFFEVIDFAAKTVDIMSHRFPAWPFPYPHETVFDGLDQMEYPMMVNDNPLEDRAETIELTDHEIFHTMFPFYMGINETKYAWMDEGWATIGEWLLSPMIDSTIEDEYGMYEYNDDAGKDFDMPITALSTQESGTNYFLNAYPKPGMGYMYLKDMLGDSLFTKALHYYIEQWHGKHPAPLDFFNCINTGSGKNLNWFFKNWFFDNGYPDLAISKASQTATKLSVSIERKGSKYVPIDFTITYNDSTTEDVHESVAAWEKQSMFTYTTSITKPVVKIELGYLYNADINEENNSFSFEENSSSK